MPASLKAAEAGNEKDLDFQKPLMRDLPLFLISDQRDATLAVLDFFSDSAVAVLLKPKLKSWLRSMLCRITYTQLSHAVYTWLGSISLLRA